MAKKVKCVVPGRIERACGDNLDVGGAFPDFWVGHISELDTPIDIRQITDVKSLDFGPYGGLRLMEGRKYAHEFNWAYAEGAGGNVSFTHQGIVRLKSTNTAEDVTLQSIMLTDDMFIIYQDNNQQLFIIGAANGLKGTAGTGTTGTTADADTIPTITVTGSERTMPLRFMQDGGYAATLTYLRSFEI